jgi:hypothetical protein
MTVRRPQVLDSVELLREVEGWRAGSLGAVVSEYPNSALVEMTTEDELEDGLPARALFDDLVSVPYQALKVVQAARTAG